MCWLVFLISFVNIFREPLASFFLLPSHYFRTVEKMFFEFLFGNKKALLIRAFYFIIKVTAMCCTIFGANNGSKLALSLLPFDVVLTNRLLFIFILIYWLDLLSIWNMLILLLLHAKI